MRIGPPDNLTIDHLRHELFGPARFVQPDVFVHVDRSTDVDQVNLTLVQPGCDCDPAASHPCDSVDAPGHGYDLPRPGDYGYPELGDAGSAGPLEGYQPGVGAPAAGNLLDVMA